MNKDIRKNREALIRHFYSLPEPLDRRMKLVQSQGKCSKKECGLLFGTIAGITGFRVNPPTEVVDAIDISVDQYDEMEKRFEGYFDYNINTFSQIADWLQTLPGWPRVL